MYIPFEPKKIPALKSFQIDEIKRMMASGEIYVQSFPKGTIIHCKGDLISAHEIIIMGEVFETQDKESPFREIHGYESLLPSEILIKQTTYRYNLIAGEDTLILFLPKNL